MLIRERTKVIRKYSYLINCWLIMKIAIVQFVSIKTLNFDSCFEANLPHSIYLKCFKIKYLKNKDISLYSLSMSRWKVHVFEYSTLFVYRPLSINDVIYLNSQNLWVHSVEIICIHSSRNTFSTIFSYW